MKPRTLLRWVVWLGILANWTFAAWAFVDSAKLVEMLGLGPLVARVRREG